MRVDAKPPQKLCEALGIDLSRELALQALTHRSYAYEHGGVPHNERLEFLGDSILGQVVTVYLFETYPDLSEGELAKRRASLVNLTTLAEAAKMIALGDYIRLGRGENQSGGRQKASILADTTEALIGAVFIDLGFSAAKQLVMELLASFLADKDHFGAAMDPKTSLQEKVMQLGLSAPVYVVFSEGPDHAKIFFATVTVDDAVAGQGKGTSKKQAEGAAAMDAWTALNCM